VCDCYSVINPSSTVRVSITDPGMTLMHGDQTVWGLVATDAQGLLLAGQGRDRQGRAPRSGASRTPLTALMQHPSRNAPVPWPRRPLQPHHLDPNDTRSAARSSNLHDLILFFTISIAQVRHRFPRTSGLKLQSSLLTEVKCLWPSTSVKLKCEITMILCKC
jgi:hypothetical protein